MDPRFLTRFCRQLLVAAALSLREGPGKATSAWWRTRPSWLRRLLLVAVATPAVVVGVVLGTAAAAHAAGTAPAVLGWIDVADGDGISIWNYELSLDRGGVTSPGKLIWSFITDLMWGLYLTTVALSIWMIDWTLSFAWLDLILSPLTNVSEALTDVVDQLGLVPTLLTIAAVVAAWQMMRGRVALGMFELLLPMLIAALAVGALANPVGLVGGESGLLYQSRDLSLGVASGLANDGDTSGSPEEFRERVTGSLTDTFVRAPAQIINFGEVLEGTRCEEVYVDVLEDGPYGEEDDIRSAVGQCESDYKDVADNPNAGMATSSMVSMVAAGLLLIFAILLSGTVLVAGVYALYQALKMIVTLLAGMLPGGARGALWMTVAELIVSLVTLVFSVVFLAVYLLMIQAIFNAGDAENRMQTFVIVDVILLVGLIVFWKGRARIKAASDRIAHALSSRPGAGPTALPQKGRFDPTGTYFKARMMGAGLGAVGSAAAGAAGAVAGAPGNLHNRVANAGARRRMSRQGAPTAGSAAGGSPGAAGSPAALGAGGAAGAPLQLPAGDAASGATSGARSGREPEGSSGSSDRLRQRMGGPQGTAGRLARAGAVVALSAATGGTSAAASMAARQVGRSAVASTARRAALTSRLQPRALPPAPPVPAATPRPSAAGSGALTGAAAAGSRMPAGEGSTAAAPRANIAARTAARAERSVGTGRPSTPVAHAVPVASPAAPARPAGTTPPDPRAAAASEESARRLRARLEARRGGAERPIALPGPRVPQSRR